MAIDVEVKGLIEVQKALEQKAAALQGAPILNAMRDSVLLIQRDAKINAPVDTGRLRASITPTIRMWGDTVTGVVGSNVEYAPFMELGTKPHWAPRAALEVWARRHGIPVYLVLRSIARKGIKARRFLQRAAQDNKERIIARFERAVKEVVEQ